MAKFKLADGTEIEAFTQEEMDAQIGGLKTKVDELLKEKKTVSQKAHELEEAVRTAKEDERKKNGQYQELYETAVRERDEAIAQVAERDANERKMAISMAANGLAMSLTKDKARAELLAEKAEQFAKYSKSGITYEIGGVPVDVAKLTEHLKSKYPFLADGSGAAGGGATGGTNGGAVKKFADYTPAELVALRKESPEKYEQIRQTR